MILIRGMFIWKLSYLNFNIKVEDERDSLIALEELKNIFLKLEEYTTFLEQSRAQEGFIMLIKNLSR